MVCSCCRQCPQGGWQTPGEETTSCGAQPASEQQPRSPWRPLFSSSCPSGPSLLPCPCSVCSLSSSPESPDAVWKCHPRLSVAMKSGLVPKAFAKRVPSGPCLSPCPCSVHMHSKGETQTVEKDTGKELDWKGTFLSCNLSCGIPANKVS